MRQISRDEYEANWEVERSGDQQSTQVLSDTKWGRMGQPTENVVMNGMQNVNTFTAEVTPMEPRKNEGFDGGRSEETDREAMKREILGEPVLDATFSGEPVGGNEEPISTLEEDRGADMDAVEDREEELSGQFQEFAPADDQLGDDDGEETPEDAPAPEDEPTAGNEDNTNPTGRTRGKSGGKRKDTKNA
jgi:hypothetical protein